MIIKNLFRRKIRTLLTMLGVAAGVASVVSLSAFGEGFASGFEGMSSSSQADLTIGQKDAMMLLISSVDQEIGDEISKLSGIEEIAGVIVGVIDLPEVPYFIVTGVDPHSFVMDRYKIIQGHPLTSRKQILLGKTTAENYKKKPGDLFRMNEAIYRVAGVYETGNGMEDGGAVLSLEDGQRAFEKRNKVNYFSVKVHDPDKIDDLKKDIEERWPKLVAIRSGDPTQQDEALNMYRSFGWFIGIFAILIGGLGMMNTSLMSVFERTREIGVLRAVGWSRWRIITMILGETVLLSLLGGIAGILMGIGLIQLAMLLPAVESMLTGTVSPQMIIQASVTALTLGAIGGIYPAWRASCLMPVEAMRYESGAGSSSFLNSPWINRLLKYSILRNLLRRPTRTIITVLGLGIGVGFIFALMGMTEGFIAMFTQIATSGQADLIAEEAGASDLGLAELDAKAVNWISGQPEVKAISRILIGYSNAPGLPYFIIFGLDPGENYIKHYNIRDGRMLQRPEEIILGRFAANGLKKKVGDHIRVSGVTFQIVGIYENGSTFEDAGGTVTLRDAQSLFNKQNKVTLVGITLKENARPNAAEVAQRMKKDNKDITVSKSSEFTENMQDFDTTYTMLNVLIIMTVFVGGIVIMNAMLMSVFERTQEIGVLRALGWKRSQVILMVLGESVTLSIISSLVGIGIGVGLNYLFTLEKSMGPFLQPAYTQNTFIQVTVLALVLGAIGGIYPAWRAANLRPIEALRYE